MSCVGAWFRIVWHTWSHTSLTKRPFFFDFFMVRNLWRYYQISLDEQLDNRNVINAHRRRRTRRKTDYTNVIKLRNVVMTNRKRDKKNVIYIYIYIYVKAPVFLSRNFSVKTFHIEFPYNSKCLSIQWLRLWKLQLMIQMCLQMTNLPIVMMLSFDSIPPKYSFKYLLYDNIYTSIFIEFIKNSCISTSWSLF